jgi:thiamine kinase-like enzyme
VAVGDPTLEQALDSVWPGEHAKAEPLAGGITNRNYVVKAGGELFVLRIAGQDTHLLGIDREAEVEAARAASAAGVGPEVVAAFPDRGILATRYATGKPIPEQDLQREDVLRLVTNAIVGIHKCPPVTSTFPVFRIVREYRDLAASRGVPIPAAYEDAHEIARRIEQAFLKSPFPSTTCHNDLLNANFIRDGDHIWVVDYEYAGVGDPFFDLGNLSINNGFSAEAQELLLRLYFGEVRDGHRARLGLMRIMSDFREAMWGVVQQGLSTLDFDYVDYADTHFSRMLQTAGDPRVDDWLDQAPEVP